MTDLVNALQAELARRKAIDDDRRRLVTETYARLLRQACTKGAVIDPGEFADVVGGLGLTVDDVGRDVVVVREAMKLEADVLPDDEIAERRERAKGIVYATENPAWEERAKYEARCAITDPIGRSTAAVRNLEKLRSASPRVFGVAK
jgi:hypothetical protein